MNRRAMGAVLGMLAACSSGGSATTDERTSAVTGPPPTLTPNWGFHVTSGNTGTGISDYEIYTQADKLNVLAAVRAVVAQKCPGDPGACEVELHVSVSDETHPAMGMLDIAGIAGWAYVIDAWSTAQQAQVAFLQQQNVSAHWLRDTLENHRELQNLLLAKAKEAVEAVHDARDALVTETHDRIAAMGGEVVSEEQVRLANTRWAIRDLERTTQRYQQILDHARPLYGDVAARYAAYRASEAATIGGLENLIAQASSAGLDDMVALKSALAAISDSENLDPQQLILDANRVRWELAHAQTEYDQAIVRHAALIDEHGWARLDHTTVPRQGMTGVVGYAEERLDRVNAAIREIIDGVRRREQALILVAADQHTRDAVRAAVAAQTEADFLDEITRRSDELWRSPPTTSTLKLPLLGERVRVMQAFLQLEPLCADPSNATWRGPGCQRVANELTKVKTYLNQTLSLTLRYGITKLRAAGVNEADLTQIDADLTAGRRAAAVHRYDAALRAVEEG